MQSLPDVVLISVAAGTGAAAAIDIRTHRIPNVISAGLAALGIGLAAAGVSGVSVGSSLAGLALAFALMLPGRLLGATGAGDVKLMAAVGALIGFERVPLAFVCTAIAGGALAIVIAVRRGRLAATISGTGKMLRASSEGRRELRAPGAPNRFSYGPAIAAGAMLAAWLAR